MTPDDQNGHANQLRLTQREFLEYAKSILIQLTYLASSERLIVVTHLLNLAFLEVADTLRNGEQSRFREMEQPVRRRPEEMVSDLDQYLRPH